MKVLLISYLFWGNDPFWLCPKEHNATNDGLLSTAGTCCIMTTVCWHTPRWVTGVSRWVNSIRRQLKYLLLTALVRIDTFIAASINVLRRINFKMWMQEVWASHRRPVKVTVFVLHGQRAAQWPFTQLDIWWAAVCVPGRVTFNMRMPLVSHRENGALCPADPWDRRHSRGDLGVSGVVWALLSVD